MLAYLWLIITLFQQDAFSRSKKESEGITFVPLKLNAKKVLTPEQEECLVTYATKVAKMFYGLPRKEFRSLAYMYATPCHSPAIPQNWDTELAVLSDWYYAFMHRYPELGL